MKPQGALNLLAKKLAQLGRTEDAAGLDAYVRSQEFIDLLSTASASHRVTLLQAYIEAREWCQWRKPVAKAGRVKADWQKPGEVERFKALLAKHARTTDDRKVIFHRVAREMRITEGAVAMAYSRFVTRAGAGATVNGLENLNRKPVERVPTFLPSSDGPQNPARV